MTARGTWFALPEAPRARTLGTLGLMAELVRSSRRDARIITLAREVALWSAAPRDVAGQASALLEHVRRHVRYIMDPVDQEVIAPAMHVLETGAGDCDELSVTLASLCNAVGIRARFVAIAPAMFAREWGHVYCELAIGERWIPADPTHPSAPLGWAPRGFRALRVEP